MATGRKLVSDEDVSTFFSLVKNKKSVKTCLKQLNINFNQYNTLKKLLNHPDTKWICTKCGEEKYNSSFTKDLQKNKHRQYVPQCKICRSNYVNSIKHTDSFKNYGVKGRKKNRISGIYSASKGNAKKRNLEHTITKDYLIKLFEKQKGLCYYTNKLMHIDITNGQDRYDSISIDRLNSNKGYIENNIVLCRWVINRMKNNLPLNKFLEIIKEIYKYKKL